MLNKNGKGVHAFSDKFWFLAREEPHGSVADLGVFQFFPSTINNDAAAWHCCLSFC
jgi:hypothetical protein